MSLSMSSITVFTGFFAVMNPVANTPIFVALTAEDSLKVQKKTAFFSLGIAFVIVSIFCFAGSEILSLFGVTLPAVRLAGGIILFFIGYDMLKGRHNPNHTKDPAEMEKYAEKAALSIAVSPLAIPLLAGPGTIAMALNYTSTGGVMESVVASLSFLVLCVISYFFFLSGERLIRYLGDSAINGITRFMGMIIAILGTQMLIDGTLTLVRHA